MVFISNIFSMFGVDLYINNLGCLKNLIIDLYNGKKEN